MFLQIVYLSTATSLFKRDQLNELLEQARLRNDELDITGLLLYKDMSFIQLIEGPEQQVSELFEAIKSDDRHYNVRLLDKTLKTERTFRQWRMGFVDITKESMDIDGFIDYFAPGVSLDAIIDTPSKALQLLAYFRQRS